MQKDLFGKATVNSLTIEQAALTAQVSTATIRNWIKTGYLIQISKGAVSQDSLTKFMQEVAGVEKLNNRANKLHKDRHNHQELTNNVENLLNQYNSDKIGEAYECSLSESHKNQEGIYYTPNFIVDDMLSSIEFGANKTFLDPCCGSGNFIIQAIKKGVDPQNVYGFDTDPNAVAITKYRIKQEFGIDTPNIQVANFLEIATTLAQKNTKFDLIFTNPPWGKKLSKADKENYAKLYRAGKSLDTSSLFFFAAFSVLNKNGYLGLLIQEAFFNISTFEDSRKKLLQKQIIKLTDYGRAFKGLVTKAQSFILSNKPAALKDEIICQVESVTFIRNNNSFIGNPKSILNFWLPNEDAAIIKQIYAVEHITLEGKCKWGLGIVTGNNAKFCSSNPQTNYVPIYKGSDITKNGFKKPSSFISNDFSKFQQVAPIELYHAKEKIVYKFISSNLEFYLDTQQCYLLNSANLLIPNANLGISALQLVQLLNSEILNWLFKKLFNTHKILRGDLELLPIHVNYFAHYTHFNEVNYLDYLGLTKSKNGTFSVKN